MKCKITHKPIKPFMSFGKMPIANGFLKKQDFSKEYLQKGEATHELLPLFVFFSS